MRKMILLLILLVLVSGTAMASDQNKTKISLSMGHYTGTMGFIVEKGLGLPAVYVGTGTTWETLILTVGGRFYIPEQMQDRNQQVQRSNVFVGPVAGVGFWSDENFHTDVWGGFTGGYDFNWGEMDEYHLTLEGGIGIVPTNSKSPYMPVFNISLGYSF